VPLKVFNSKSRSKENFEPLNAPKVSMYVCGITAYDYCHLGHARAAVVFDVIYRYLKHRGYEVTFVRNFTDIDDKIIRRAQESKKDWKEVAETFMRAFEEDMKSLGNLKPDQEPKATEYIAAMQEIITRLVEKNAAYPAAGDVFFSVRNFPSYGELAQKNLEDLQAGARVEVQESKKDPLDFALWKGAKPGEPEWDSPWGKGRPGWHIECSAMSTKLFGPSLDIHGGGRDLIFPHHENERAQSEAAFGKPFVKYWLHNGFVNLNADKMSKSTGNFLTIRDVLTKYPHEAVRYFLLSAHYRSPLDFNDNAMEEALAAIDRVYETLARLKDFSSPAKQGGRNGEIDELFKSFSGRVTEAMDDDFNTASVLGYTFDAIREINKFLDSGPEAESLKKVQNQAREMCELLGSLLGVFAEEPSVYLKDRKLAAMKSLPISEEEVAKLLQERREARAGKNFKRADQIRDELIERGILLKDNPDGTTTWTVK